MFAKSAVLFFALVAFVDAAPVVDYSVRPLDPIKTPPSYGVDYTVDVHPLDPINLPIVEDEVHPKRGLPLEISANPGVDVRPLEPITFPLPVALKRDLSLDVGSFPSGDVHPSLPVGISLPGLHPGILKRDNFAGLDFSFNSDLNLNLPKTVGLDVNANQPVHPRNVDIGSVLSQLQSITTTLANLLHARDLSGGVNSIGSQLNDLQTEAVTDANNLLNTLNGLLSSAH